MFYRFFLAGFLTLPALPLGVLAQTAAFSWSAVENDAFTLYFSGADSARTPQLAATLAGGASSVRAFFTQPFPRRFDVWCFPDRPSLDRQWQHDWGDSTFQSACWMVAAGVAQRLDLLSPAVWSAQACEHRDPLAGGGTALRRQKDSVEFQRLLTHELVHVYHGQHCRVPDFAGMDALGWWVEGLATYASGQLDSARLQRVRSLLREGKAPAQLSEFWSGPERYGLAGSVVAALDVHYGRSTLLRLLPLSTSAEIYAELHADEADILRIWRTYLEVRE